MAVLQLATQCFARQDYRLPPAQVFNLFAEASKPGVVSLLPRPGLQRRFLAGNGPIRGMFQAAGVFASSVFIASGNQLYRKDQRLTTGVGGNSASIGFVPSDPTFARFAASKTQLTVISNGYLYIYQDSGGGIFKVTRSTNSVIPANGFADCCYLADRFYYTTRNSDVVWYTSLDDADGLDALQYFTVDHFADPILAAEVLGDEIIFFGAGSIEPWAPTVDPNNPLAPGEGRIQDKGTLAQATVVAHDNSIVFLRSDLTICRYGDPSMVISTPDIEEQLRHCNDANLIGSCTAYSIGWDGHAFYVLNIPGQGTFAYDSATQQWCQWGSYGEPQLRISCGLVTSSDANGALWLGDYDTGMIWKFTPSQYFDGGQKIGDAFNIPIQRVASTAFPLQSGTEACFNVMLYASRGVGNAAEPDPHVEMHYSDDVGESWSRWHHAPLGKQGKFRDRASWRRLGRMRSPGRAFEFRCTDPVLTVFKSVSINEERP